MDASRRKSKAGYFGRPLQNIGVQLVSNDTLQGAKGAFVSSNPDGEAIIYLNKDWLASGADKASVAQVLIEEFGHSLDAALNPGGDTPGDEGEIFSRAVLNGVGPLSASFIDTLDDHGTLIIDGQSVQAEFASFSFVTAYEIVGDIEASNSTPGIISNGLDTRLSSDTYQITGADINQTYEYAIDKESNNHNFIYTAAGLGKVTISDAVNSTYFSGNDVSAIGLNIAGRTYYGWISRPMKVGGEVVGFYFWTDVGGTINAKPAFTDLATAQADGNQDGDSSTLDNRAFVLVVNKSYFDNTLGYVSRAGVAANTFKVIGSSSDRVDSALNSLIGSNTAPVATSDTADGTNGTVAAVESGFISSSGVNTTVSSVNGSGNVLTNDTDANGDTLAVSKIGTSSATQTTVASGTNSLTGTIVTGTYGTLTIGADGSYSYAVNNSNHTVDALQVGSTLNDVFTYTVSDGNGGTASTTLTVVIKGTDDAPVANPDYNTAKESTTTAITGSNYTGYSATGNVLPNDTDVDAADTKSILGASVSGSYTGAFTVNAATSVLTFNSSNGQSLGSIANGLAAYIALGAAPASNTYGYFGLYYYNGTTYAQVTESGLTKNPDGTYSLTLSKIPNYYASSGPANGGGTPTGYTAIANINTFFASNPNIDFYSSTAWEAKGSQGKGATISTSTSSASTDIAVSGSVTGTVAVGMSVSGTNVVSGTTVSSLTYDASGVLTSIRLSQALTGATTGSETFSFTGSSGVGSTLYGAHGTMVLNSDGSYTYTPNTDNPYLSSGQSAIEAFDYTMKDSQNVTSSSKLYITVYGTGSSDPSLSNDSGTAYESGVGRNPATNALTSDNTAYGGATATGNVLTNDTPGTGGSVASYSKSDGTGTVTFGNTLTGSYGQLSITSAGAYTYTVNNSNSAVNALLPGSSLSETFLYKVTNTAGGSGWAQLVITIQGTDDQPVAVADTAAVTVNSTLTSTGNVLANDTDVDSNDTKVVLKAGTSSATTSVTSGTTASNGLPVTGTYGNLVIGADGTYLYTLRNSDANVQALAAGQQVGDVFTYQVQDSSGATNTITLTVTVTGSNKSPVNTLPASVTASLNSDYTFTGGTAISVGDVDGNLSSVTLHVDHGVLSSTYSTGLTLSGNGTGDVTISGSQANINNYLAALKYTPNNNFTGADYFTIFSRDSNNAYDSDGFAINIPTNTTASVSEAALNSVGSNPGSTAETYAGNLSLASGQTINSQQTGTTSHGSWTVNTGGSFSFTLTSPAGNSSGPITETFSYIVYDSFGNSVTNTVSVTINDDTPTATADAVSVVTGATQTGNVQSNDVFGADGPKQTGPSRAVIGFTTGSNTSSAVTSNLGAQISGSYGALTLNADGSFSYVANAGVTGSPTDSFVYTIEDGDGSRSTTTLIFTVLPAGVASADLAITKTVNTATPSLNGDVIYTLVAHNNGGNDATGVHVTDQLPAGLSFVAASTDPAFGSTVNSAVYNSSTGQWTIGNLANGASATLYLKATVTSTAAITNTAAIAGDQYDPQAANDTDSGSDNNQTVNVPPIASNDNATYTPGVPATIDVLANDNTAGVVVAATVEFTSPNATNGGKTLVVSGQGVWTIDPVSGAMTFNPEAGFAGSPAAVQYKVADVMGNYATAVVTLTGEPLPLNVSQIVEFNQPQPPQNSISQDNTAPSTTSNSIANNNGSQGREVRNTSGDAIRPEIYQWQATPINWPGIALSGDRDFYHQVWGEQRIEILEKTIDLKIDNGHEFALPPEAIMGLNTNDSLRFDAHMANGAELPEWIHFDRNDGSLHIDANAPIDSRNEVVKVVATDTKGNQVTVTVILKSKNVQTEWLNNMPSNHRIPQPPTGKPAMSEQIKQGGSRGLQSEAAKFLNQFSQLFNDNHPA